MTARPSRSHAVVEGQPGTPTGPASAAVPPGDGQESTGYSFRALLRRGNFWLSIFFLVLSVVLIAWTFLASSGRAEQGPIGPWDWPRGVLALLGVSALADILAELRSVLRGRRATLVSSQTPGVGAAGDTPEAALRPGQDLVGEPVVEQAPAGTEPPRPEPAAGAEVGTEAAGEAGTEVFPRSVGKLLVGTALVVGYVIAVPTLGFLIATLLFLLLFIYLGGYRRVVWTPVVAVVATLIIAYLFVKVVYIPLPLGAGPFVDIESSIYHALGLF